MEGWTRVGAGARSEIYAQGNRAIKLMSPGYLRVDAFHEAYLTTLVEMAGLPVARIYEVREIEGRMALVMDYIEGLPVADIMLADLANAPAWMEELVTLQKKVHATRASVPYRLKDGLAVRIAASSSSCEETEKMLNYLRSLPDGDALCHGDLHGFNVIARGEERFIIDWPNAACGPAEADACRTYLLYALKAPEAAELFLDLYCGGNPARRSEVLAWLPPVAAARRTEGFAEDMPMLDAWMRLPQ